MRRRGRRADPVRHPGGQGRPRLGRRRPGGHRPAGPARPGRRGRRRHRAHGRPVPGRVHRPRPLRRLTAAGEVDNDATLERYASIAVAQAAAGAHVVAPSGMMDGQVGAIRTALDAAGFPERRRSARTRPSTPRRSTGRSATPPSARRSSATGPPTSRTRQRRTRRCARSLLDVDEGADIVMVKPALAYLDIISQVAAAVAGAGGRLPGQRRVRDGRGGRGERLAGPGPGDHGDADRDPPGRARASSSPTGPPKPPAAG